ncbi:MAG: DUF3810 domain-containing protein [Clostridiales bacterium]|nr:DUF3810 domain-containing protein [Clostridiales bacterium]
MLHRRTMYEEITAPTKRSYRWLLVNVLWCAVPGAFLLVFLLTRSHQGLMNFLVNRVTTPVKHLLSRLCGLLPFALAEVIWAAGVIAVVLFLARTVWLLIRRKERLKRLLRRVLAALAAALVVYSCYTAMWGVNYYADSFSQRTGLTARGCTAEELTQLAAAFADKCNELSDQMDRDGDGVTQLDAAEVLQQSTDCYQVVFEEFPALEQPLFTPKAMVFSRIISYMGFTGFYFPMTAESLVNVDQPDCLIAATALHELSHQCNVAEEDACNFLAIIAGLHCDNVTFQYSSAVMGYIHLSNALYSADKSAWQAVRATLNEQVLTDLTDNNAYWAQFESPVQEASEQIYTGFLESYGQTEGMKSYGQCVDLLVAYYFDT